jgi:hypothetical protein
MDGAVDLDFADPEPKSESMSAAPVKPKGRLLILELLAKLLHT